MAEAQYSNAQFITLSTPEAKEQLHGVIAKVRATHLPTRMNVYMCTESYSFGEPNQFIEVHRYILCCNSVHPQCLIIIKYAYIKCVGIYIVSTPMVGACLSVLMHSCI